MLEALFPIFAHVIEEEGEALACEIEIDAIDLNRNDNTSSSTMALPTPPPEPLFMNNKIGLESPYIKINNIKATHTKSEIFGVIT